MKQYHSRMDFLTVLINLLAVFVIDAAALFASSKALVRESGLTSFGLFLGAVSAPVALMLFFFPVRYFLGNSLLVVRSGVLRWRIPVENIHRAVRLRSIVPPLRPSPWNGSASTTPRGVGSNGSSCRRPIAPGSSTTWRCSTAGSPTTRTAS